MLDYSSINTIEQFLKSRKYSSIYTSNPDPNIYPNYYKAKRYEIELNEGECIYIPYGWFHHVYSEKTNKMTNINMAINFWSSNENKDELNILSYDYNSIVINKIYDVNRNTYLSFNNSNIPFTSHINLFTTEQLYQLLSCNNYTVYHNSNNIYEPNSICDYTSEIVTFNEFMNLRNRPNQYSYIIQNQIFDKTNELIQYIEPKYINNDDYTKINMWINFGNVITIPHYDLSENILCQIQGSKRLFLFPPNEANNLYLYNPFNMNLLDSIKNIYENSLNTYTISKNTYTCIYYKENTIPQSIYEKLNKLIKNKSCDKMKLSTIDSHLDNVFLNILKLHINLYASELQLNKRSLPYTQFQDSGYTIMHLNFNSYISPIKIDYYPPKNAFLKYIWFLNDSSTTFINGQSYDAKMGSLLIYPYNFTYIETELKKVENKCICYGFLYND